MERDFNAALASRFPSSSTEGAELHSLADTMAQEEVEINRVFPVLTSVLFLCRECLLSPGLTTPSRIERLLDAYLDSFSSRNVWQACRSGLSRRALDYLAARDPGWDNGDGIAEYATVRGFLHVLEWLGERYPGRTTWVTADGGSLMDTAAEFGHLPIVQWLHANRSEGCTSRAMDRAAALGHLEVLQWLHLYRSEGCTKQAMNEGCNKSAVCAAAANGHLSVVRFLLENRREVSAGDAMLHAAGGGHLEMVQWLYVHRGDSHLGAALRYAAENGREAVVEWLYWIVRDQRRGSTCIQEAAELARKAGHKKVAKQLEDKFKRPRESKKKKKPGKKSKRKRHR